MRGRKALYNTLFAIIQEVVSVLCAFILPRLILESFGSTYNGLTQSITQFLGMAVLLRAGIGGATRAALYKPLSEENINGISAIMNATAIHLRKISVIIGSCIVGFACIYPFFVLGEFNWLFTFTLFLIIGFSTFAETMFGISGLILLQADQKLYIYSIISIISIILNTAISALLINLGCSIHIVKMGSAFAFCLKPLLINIYIHHYYRIDKSITPDYSAIKQRWDAFFHQLANFVMSNTDIVVLTVFVPMKEVSVYSVYNLISTGIRRLVMNFTNGMEAGFGNMIASRETETVKKNFEMVQTMIFFIASIVYITSALLILEFVGVYTKGINDSNYIRPLFAYVLVASQFFLCIRQPYQLIVQAAGHYRQTRNGAILEPIINIIVSVVAVWWFGLVGVVCGTLAATIFRTIQYGVYVSKNLVEGCHLSLLKNLFISIIDIAVVIIIYQFIPLESTSSYFEWVIHAIIAMAITSACTVGFMVVFQRTQFVMMIKKMYKIIKR